LNKAAPPLNVAALLVIAVLALAAAACDDGGDVSPAKIVYEAQQSGVTNVYAIDPVSGETTQLTRSDSFDGNPAWSPDRKRIIFSSRRDGQGLPDLYVMDADGGDVRRLTDTPNDGEWSAKFSPDGGRLAFSRNEEDGYSLYVMDADGSNERQLAGPYPFVEFPAWVPGGEELYFAAIMPTPEGASAEKLHIYSVPVAGGDVRVRINTGGTDACPHFSRDGTRLTYASSQTGGQYDTGSNMELYAHDLSSDDTSGAGDTRLTDDAARDDYGNPSPDDREMVFISDRDGNSELYLMDRDGENPRRLTNTPDARENVPDW
jgi:TolB protein